MKIFITALAAMILFACNSKNRSDVAISDLSRKTEDNKAPLANANEKYAGLTDTATGSYFQVSDNGKQKDDRQQQQQQKHPPVQQPKIDWDKKIIKTAILNLEVKAYNKFYKSLREKVTQFGGYVAQEQQTQTDYKLENTLVIKVPVDQFDNALNLVTTDVEKINEKRVTSEDVTAEVVDTKSRIEAKRQIRLRYLDLLKQARNMEEILNVQSEINGVQEEIESASGRVNYLTHSAAYSTINLTFYEILNAAAATTNEKPSFASRISTAFGSGWSWVGEIFVGIISIWPLLILVALIIIFLRRSKVVKTKPA